MTTRILLVEDNEMSRDMLSRRLVRAAYEVITAADGEQAITLVRQERPDVVLLDMGLPIKDGWTTCKEIREEDAIANTPIIALTAHVMRADRDKALAAGCDDYATKPIDFPMLLEKINALSCGRVDGEGDNKGDSG
ncbi:MAG: response regulator [Gammaproteobacteria bacterium]|nr:response regulator [Gammaproteobacteria bacterium]